MDLTPAAGAGSAFFPEKESARRVAARGFPVRSGGSAPPSCAATSDPRRAGGCRGRSLLRVRRGGPGSEWLHDGSNGGPVARIAFLPVPDAEGRRFAGRRSPGREIPHAPQTRSPRPPKHGKRSGRGATGGSDGRQRRRLRPSGCDRPRLRMPMRMRGTRHARYLQTLPQIYLYAAILLQPYPHAEYAYADIT